MTNINFRGRKKQQKVNALEKSWVLRRFHLVLSKSGYLQHKFFERVRQLR